MSERETLPLIGGSRAGETVTVAIGLPWVRMPRRVPFAPRMAPPAEVRTASPDDSEIYERRKWQYPTGKVLTVLVLKGLSESEAAKAIDGLPPAQPPYPRHDGLTLPAPRAHEQNTDETQDRECLPILRQPDDRAGLQPGTRADARPYLPEVVGRHRQP